MVRVERGMPVVVAFDKLLAFLPVLLLGDLFFDNDYEVVPVFLPDLVIESKQIAQAILFG